MQNIIPCLWFNDQAEAAVRFYTSVFRNSRILTTTHYGEAGPLAAGTVMTIKFELDGVEHLALNGGPAFTFTEAISLVVQCKTQAEIDYFWETLSAGGEIVECGWLKDKFGLFWQVVPEILDQLVQDANPAKRDRVMAAMLKMKKLDIKALQAA